MRSALALYDTQFKNSKTYLLHGDLHHYNLLRTAEGYRAIDPIGCLAPIEFEFTRFIRNDILQHPGFDPRKDYSFAAVLLSLGGTGTDTGSPAN